MTEQIKFNQSLFDACPTGMLVLDQNASILWLNPALEKMLSLEGSELIGQSRETLPEDLHALFDETDALHLSLNGQGDRWLHREVCEVRDGADQPLQLHFYQDISGQVLARQEGDQLRQQVQTLTITDELTGLANRRATLQALEVQVTRSRRYGNRLTLGAVQISHGIDPTIGLQDESVLTFTQFLRERLRWADTIGRYEDQLFLLVMPETSRDDASKLLTAIQQECLDGALESMPENVTLKLHVSAAAWQKGDDSQRLIQRCLRALE